MFWFVTIFLIATMCAGIVCFAMGIRFLKFGDEAAAQERTIKIVVVSFIEILVGGFALAALVTGVVDPLIALIVTLGTLLLTLLGFRIKDR